MASKIESYVCLCLLAVSGIRFIWNRIKFFTRVGKVSKLYIYPVKSLKGIEVSSGRCTTLGFEVNGLLDRSFMLVIDGVSVTYRQEPSLVLLSPQICDNYLIINGPDVEPLKVEIKQSPSPEDKIIDYIVYTDIVGGVDCGDEAAHWFQSYLKKNVRFVRFFPHITTRRCIPYDPFFRNLREKYPAGFQKLGAIDIISQHSIEDLNSRLTDETISVLNFRPNILVDGCGCYAEDSWKHLKVANKKKHVEMVTVMLTSRGISTTNDPETGILSKKEPIVTLRKYRIPTDSKGSKITGPLPCLGTTLGVLSSGDIAVGDDILALVEEQPEMLENSETLGVLSSDDTAVGDDISAVVGEQPEMLENPA